MNNTAYVTQPMITPSDPSSILNSDGDVNWDHFKDPSTYAPDNIKNFDPGNLGNLHNSLSGNDEIMAFNSEEAQKQRDWQSEESQKARDFEERMSNSAYSRAVNDMKNAGINPASLTSGSFSPASTPSSSSSGGSSASGSNSSYSPLATMLRGVSSLALLITAVSKLAK